jgi:hypothetical protein
MPSLSRRSVASGLAGLALSQALVGAQAPDHRAWARVQPPSAASDARKCANWTEWSVRVAKTKSRDLLATIDIGRHSALAPKTSHLSRWYLTYEVRDGRSGKRTEDGYVVVFTRGEFGGSLWWYSPSGTARTRIADAAVVGFADIQLPSRRVVIGTIEGLAHLSVESGRVRLVDRSDADSFAMTVLANLTAAPQAVSQATDGTLVVTNTSILRVGGHWCRHQLADVISQTCTQLQLSRLEMGRFTLARVATLSR